VKADIDEKACLALDRESDVHTYVFRVARMAASRAKRYSSDRTGHYDAAMFSSRDRGAKAMSTFGSTDFKAWWMEFGAHRSGSYFAPRAPLRKAVRSLGLRFDRRRK
jgi:hypothetical protein